MIIAVMKANVVAVAKGCLKNLGFVIHNLPFPVTENALDTAKFCFLDCILIRTLKHLSNLFTSCLFDYYLNIILGNNEQYRPSPLVSKALKVVSAEVLSLSANIFAFVSTKENLFQQRYTRLEIYA